MTTSLLEDRIRDLERFLYEIEDEDRIKLIKVRIKELKIIYTDRILKEFKNGKT